MRSENEGNPAELKAHAIGTLCTKPNKVIANILGKVRKNPGGVHAIARAPYSKRPQSMARSGLGRPTDIAHQLRAFVEQVPNAR